MATKGKESAHGKEKRGISPTHHADTTQRRRSPNPSTTDSIDHKHGGGATQSEKRVPNYLKPTISSSHDPSMHTKKQTSNTTAQKPLLNRRRSLEKPPSSSQLCKTRTSPSPGERNLRSSSAAVLPKTTTSPKTHTERLPKAPRNIGKSNSFSARPGSVKKSTRTTIKKLNNETSSAKAPSSISSDGANTPTFESEQEDLESWASEVEKEIVIKVESNNEVPTEISISEDNEDVDMQVQAELENEEEEQLIKPCESSNILEHQNASLSAEILKDPVDKVYVDQETNDDHHEGEEEVHGTEESDKNQPEESSAVGEPKVESDEQKEGEEVTTEKSQGKAPEENEEVDDGSRTLNSKEREEEEGVAKEAKPEAENVMAKRQGGQGKKDSPASNDVIEETASRLLEMRKNKVKALVGAFETVMNLQEPEA